MGFRGAGGGRKGERLFENERGRSFFFFFFRSQRSRKREKKGSTSRLYVAIFVVVSTPHTHYLELCELWTRKGACERQKLGRRKAFPLLFFFHQAKKKTEKTAHLENLLLKRRLVHVEHRPDCEARLRGAGGGMPPRRSGEGGAVRREGAAECCRGGPCRRRRRRRASSRGQRRRSRPRRRPCGRRSPARRRRVHRRQHGCVRCCEFPKKLASRRKVAWKKRERKRGEGIDGCQKSEKLRQRGGKKITFFSSCFTNPEQQRATSIPAAQQQPLSTSTTVSWEDP